MWTLPQKVRDAMGIDNDAILDDRQIEEHIRMAQEKVKESLFTYHYDETVMSNPDTGASWDGSNTTYRTSHYPIMDSDYDFTVDGDDIKGRWLSSTYAESNCSISISSATYGIISVYQHGTTTAIPANAETVRVDYYSCHRSISKQHLENLATWATADSIMHTLKAGTSVSMEDLEKNAKLLLQDPNQFNVKYKELMNKLQSGTIIGV